MEFSSGQKDITKIVSIFSGTRIGLKINPSTLRVTPEGISSATLILLKIT